MANKTLADLRTSVARRYGDTDLITLPASEIAEYLEAGYSRVCTKCPWLTSDTQTVTATTGVLGQITLTEPDIGAIVQVAILKGTIYEPLTPVSLLNFNQQYNDVASTVSQITGYAVEGATLYLHPILEPVGSVTVRVTYQNAQGLGFPALDTDQLPATMPSIVDDIIVIWALYEAYRRDNDFEAANFALADFQNRIQDLVAIHNRPQMGGPMTVTQTDFYLLDAEYDAW